MSLGNALRIVLNKNKKYCIQEIQIILQCIQNDDDEEKLYFNRDDCILV